MCPVQLFLQAYKNVYYAKVYSWDVSALKACYTNSQRIFTSSQNGFAVSCKLALERALEIHCFQIRNAMHPLRIVAQWFNPFAARETMVTCVNKSVPENCNVTSAKSILKVLALLTSMESRRRRKRREKNNSTLCSTVFQEMPSSAWNLIYIHIYTELAHNWIFNRWALKGLTSPY